MIDKLVEILRDLLYIARRQKAEHTQSQSIIEKQLASISQQLAVISERLDVVSAQCTQMRKDLDHLQDERRISEDRAGY